MSTISHTYHKSLLPGYIILILVRSSYHYILPTIFSSMFITFVRRSNFSPPLSTLPLETPCLAMSGLSLIEKGAESPAYPYIYTINCIDPVDFTVVQNIPNSEKGPVHIAAHNEHLCVALPSGLMVYLLFIVSSILLPSPI